MPSMLFLNNKHPNSQMYKISNDPYTTSNLGNCSRCEKCWLVQDSTFLSECQFCEESRNILSQEGTDMVLVKS